MAANKTVIVLAPNGRRQSVKVTLNTTILQILEEVCRKQGYNIDDYDIKHIHRILDLNAIFRFTGLPNNAQLEMVPCTKARSASSLVTIGIQPESGERTMREFSPDTTLARVLTSIFPDSDIERAVLIYMHREVCGRKALEETTLKLLGLNSGRAILRLIYRDLGQSKVQAHVSAPLLPKPAAVNNSSSDKDCQGISLSVLHRSETTGGATLPSTTESMQSTDNRDKSSDEVRMDIEEEEARMDVDDEKIDARSKRSVNCQRETNTLAIEETRSVASSQRNPDIATDVRNPSIADSSACRNIEEDSYKIEFLGERNALAFSQAGVEALPKDELPDSFFDLDLHDARTLMRDAKRLREQLENAPLLTEAQRQLDRDKRTLEQLNKYRCTVIRVQFPDQLVLQGLFGPLEKIQTVKDFIKNYLDDPDRGFAIYTTPPKHVLNPEMRLIDENLVPSAIIHYSGQSSLKPSVKAKLTDPRIANIQAVRFRIDTRRKNQDPAIRDDKGTINENSNDHVIPIEPSGSKSSSSLSLSSSSSSSLLLSSPAAQNRNKAPKWFRQAFK